MSKWTPGELGVFLADASTKKFRNRVLNALAAGMGAIKTSTMDVVYLLPTIFRPEVLYLLHEEIPSTYVIFYYEMPFPSLCFLVDICIAEKRLHCTRGPL